MLCWDLRPRTRSVVPSRTAARVLCYARCSRARMQAGRALDGSGAPGREAPMPLYVIQVVGGQESRMCELVSKLLGSKIEECFIPRREVFRHEKGAWQTVREILFPGYLFVKTDEIQQVLERLTTVPALTRLLGVSDDRITPLSDDEVAWLAALMKPGEKLIEKSVGVIEGDRVIVTEGPLVGHEAQIRKVDRHKRLAYLDMRMFGRTKTIKVGLEIVRKSV